jgi:hypothetical protein
MRKNDLLFVIGYLIAAAGLVWMLRIIGAYYV